MYQLHLLVESHLLETDEVRHVVVDLLSAVNLTQYIVAADHHPRERQIRKEFLRVGADVVCRKNWNGVCDENVVLPLSDAAILQTAGDGENPLKGGQDLGREGHDLVVVNRLHSVALSVTAAGQTVKKTPHYDAVVVLLCCSLLKKQNTATEILSSS